ncbi:FecR family protein [Pseudomonas jinjuensis]|uniref:FecR family protein n=1 Tax=Pseudomonas jinjuensis TaxID=198616 RepID=A0A1H0C779_9PSED|nr:FecR domain-containing protein [Pseudomonas jinjuensis]SDN53717.1 FecR family protein [Pseudomonas jinjuensis]
MNPIDHQLLSDQAIERLAHLHSGRATAAERMAFHAWRGQSPAHEAAAREAEALWGALPQTRSAEQFVAASRRNRRRLLLGGALAACVAVLAVAVALPRPLAGLYADYSTRVGERRSIELADGSQVWLNSGSALSVEFSSSERRLRLHAGEALFEVAKDPQRPFIVRAGDTEVMAVGTRFDVDARGPRTRVDVSEGVVQVSDARHPTVRLSAGERLDVAERETPAAVQALDLDSASAWQRGKLIFNQRPLGDVLDELERYLPQRILLTDAALRRHKVSGVFDLDDPGALLKTLERLQPVRVTRLPGVILVRPVARG